MSEQTSTLRGGVEFTHEWYRALLEHLRGAGYRFVPFENDLGADEIALRHDVDLSLGAARRMAQLESELDIQSTYCVLVSSSLYNPLDEYARETLEEIRGFGHDVALHFSTHTYWEGEPATIELERRVREEQSILGAAQGSVPRTVSFHRPPSWVLDRKFEGFQSTYAPRFFSEVEYIADSSQRWREDPPPWESLPDRFQLLTHPGLWSERDTDFERQVERAVIESCRQANRAAHDEFIGGQSSA